MTAEDVHARITRLEAHEAVRALVARYAMAADGRNDSALMGPLFAEDAYWEATGIVSFKGRQAIIQGLVDIAAKRILRSLHHMASPLIEIDPANAGTGSNGW